MSQVDISKGIHALSQGKLVVYPTDTLYALGADVFNDAAVSHVFRVKKRPMTQPIPIAVANMQELETIAVTNEKIKAMINRLLPGKLTVVLLKRERHQLQMVTSGSEKIAIRIPDNTCALALLSRYGPLTVTSANIHGEETPIEVKEIQRQFAQDDIAVYLDCGECAGEPSTIVDMTAEKPVILRQGTITEEMIHEAIEHE